MISPISNGTQVQPVEAPQGKSAAKQPESKQSPAGDSVQLSKAAQATLAALQETRETAAQTAKEAGGGDLQAQRLLAKEAAQKAEEQ